VGASRLRVKHKLNYKLLCSFESSFHCRRLFAEKKKKERKQEERKEGRKERKEKESNT
jgi:hypothetical protein